MLLNNNQQVQENEEERSNIPACESQQDPPSREEVMEAIKSLPSNKASEISGKLLKSAGDE